MNTVEDELLFISIHEEHNRKIINNALNTLKQFAENGEFWLFDENGNSFKLTPDTEYINYSFVEEKEEELLWT